MYLTEIINPYIQNRMRYLTLKVLSALIIFVFQSTSTAQIAVSAPAMVGQDRVTCRNIELMKQIPCPDSELFFHQGKALVQRAFNAIDYDRLDTLYEQWCTGSERFPDGRWKLSQYGDGLSDNFSAWKKWSKDLDTIKEWQKTHPKSEAAKYAEAIYWRSYAWSARGSGYSSTVSKEGWELFYERLNKAKEILGTLIKSPPVCPAPYPLALSLLTELGATESQLRDIYIEGTSRFPEYHNIYFSMSKHYQPKWGGSIEKYDTFAKQVAEQTKKFEGMGMYARLYWLVDSTDGIPFYENSGSPPEWNKLHTGYEDLIRKYPSSMHNLGKYTDVVCRTSESKLYRELRTKINGYEPTAEMVDPIDVCDKRHQWLPEKK